uniref:Uncharacterized protein n=1 Tax=Opuntia streptacantha TaxID=393608 RepID=A0A7C9AUV4_OPUST
MALSSSSCVSCSCCSWSFMLPIPSGLESPESASSLGPSFALSSNFNFSEERFCISNFCVSTMPSNSCNMVKSSTFDSWVFCSCSLRLAFDSLRNCISSSISCCAPSISLA